MLPVVSARTSDGVWLRCRSFLLLAVFLVTPVHAVIFLVTQPESGDAVAVAAAKPVVSLTSGKRINKYPELVREHNLTLKHKTSHHCHQRSHPCHHNAEPWEYIGHLTGT